MYLTIQNLVADEFEYGETGKTNRVRYLQFKRGDVYIVFMLDDDIHKVLERLKASAEEKVPVEVTR